MTVQSLVVKERKQIFLMVRDCPCNIWGSAIKGPEIQERKEETSQHLAVESSTMLLPIPLVKSKPTLKDHHNVPFKSRPNKNRCLLSNPQN
jgi:hypothetical protein